MKNKEFYKKTAKLAVPIMMQNMITIGVNMADNIMVGSLGENALSAVALANQFVNIYQFSCMGLGQGASVLTSRFWGMKNHKALKQTITLTTRICLVLGLLFTVLTLFFPGIVMKIYINDQGVIDEGIRYLKVLSVSCLLMGMSLTYSNFYRSIENAKWPLLSSIFAFFINIFCNYIFIFGKLGAPCMGVAGAALGTLIARIFEFFFICGYLIFFDQKIKYRIKDLFLNCRNLVKEYIQISFPVVISDTLYGFGNSAVSMVMGRIGSQFVSANSITIVTQQLSSVFVQGAAMSSSVVIGHTLGEGNQERARKEGGLFLKMGVWMGAAACVIIIAISGPVISCYNITQETALIAKELMYSMGIIMLFRGANSIMTKGVLRGGGDTRFLMVADVLFLWVASIPLGYLTGVVLHLPAFWVYCFLKIDEVIKCFWCVGRFKSGKWIKKIKG
ncbi:MAG: MATE family efflux transporter [Lachnospiraceae bacterium]|jgi:putative MATE family efflux protein|nr:MATE family efflux transporter [Lachnospiraceae bacterium]NBH25393.1 MATE family efflux transporter [Lachnospiraceae bacterium]GFI14942.1 putative FMN/FAD exporter YeeO [Lachnospiraceae bacterium]